MVRPSGTSRRKNADAIIALEGRIQMIREKMPLIATGAVILSFLIGLAV